MAERQFGPYRLVRQIAVGGMAEIHLAKTKGIAGFEKYVALKMIHPNFAEDEQFIQMLVDEAKIAVHLTHANIAQTFDLGRVGDTYYITMEYVDGSDLYKILRRASEIDVEMPLDICAFVGKEMLSALDHAHRKRDHTGKPLGIVHRDVSPQNVLLSYAGEVKLVDFGIAKATSKAKQTAVGVIKGKYYYMSPEQAWGDPIDHRSDIFSAGIVIYEMMTGQMLYLEEDLHKLLDMVRKADIAPPSRLRKGIPPQLERIVMHALAKVPGERYQSAGDFATDLERFLHGYAPAFAGSKVAALIRKVLGDPQQIAEAEPEIEVRDGLMSTAELDANQLAHTADEIERDENSMIFSVEELKARDQAKTAPKAPAPKPPAPKQPAPKQPTGPVRAVAPRQPTPAAASPVVPPSRPPGIQPARAAGIQPSPVNRVASKPLPGLAAAQRAAATKPAPKPAPKPRAADEETRELAPQDIAGGGAVLDGDSAADNDGTDPGILAVTPKPGPATQRHPSVAEWDASETQPGADDLDGIGERTMITAPDFMSGGSGFQGDDGHEGGEATMITTAPRGPDLDDDEVTGAGTGVDGDDTFSTDDDDEGPTMQREFDRPMVAAAAKPKPVPKKKQPAPPALSAKIQTPSVSAVRTPRPSRRTPPGGVPQQQGNVLQAIVHSQPQDAMPTPRPAKKTAPPPLPIPASTPAPPPPGMAPPAFAPPGMAPPGMAPPPAMQAPIPDHTPQQPQYQQYPPQQYQQPYPQPGYPPQPQQYSGQMPVQQPYGYPPNGYPPTYPPQQQYPSQPMTPNALYPVQLYGGPPQQSPVTLTGALRLTEGDALPDAYKLDGKKRWVGLVVAGVIAISVAAGVTFLIIRGTRNTAPTVANVYIDSQPGNAELSWDGTRMSTLTPFHFEGVPVGTRHELKIELPRYKPYVQDVDVPTSGGDVHVTALLEKLLGKIALDSKPEGAEIRINGELRGRTPTTLTGIDMESAKTLDVRLKDFQPITQDLKWPPNGQIDLVLTLVPSR